MDILLLSLMCSLIILLPVEVLVQIDRLLPRVGGLLGDPLVNMNGKITDASTLFTGYISLANVANRPSDGGMLSIDFGNNRGYQLYFNVFNNRIKGRGYSNDSWTDWADIL